MPPEAYVYGLGHRLLSDGANAFAHGVDGALQSDGGLTYEADALGRIVAVLNGGTPLLELDYDAFGRVSALRPAGEPERTFQYLGAFVEQESAGGAADRQITLHPVTGVPIAYHSAAGTHFALVDARFNLLALSAPTARWPKFTAMARSAHRDFSMGRGPRCPARRWERGRCSAGKPTSPDLDFTSPASG